MFDVIALGESLIDFSPVSTDESGYPTMAAHPGGAPANFLAALSKYGASTAMLGKVGDDAFGHLLLKTMKEAGICTDGVICDPEVFTTLAFVTLGEHGDRDFSFARKPGADTQLCFEELNKEMLADCRILHIGTLSLTDEPVRETTRKAVAFAKEQGILISCDPNLRKPLWKDPEEAGREMQWALSQADIVKISDDEVDFLWHCGAEKGAEILLNDFGVKLAFVTCGPEGAYFANRKAAGRVCGRNDVHPVDTTGAGDVFGGSAVWKILAGGIAPEELDGDRLRDIVRFAVAAAGLSTEQYGGISSVPELDDVLDLLGRDLSGK